MRALHLLLLAPLLGCGPNSEDLGLIASAAMHAVEQSRSNIEGLDTAQFGNSSLFSSYSGDQFTLAGQVPNSCGGAAAVSGSGSRADGQLSYQMQLTLSGWASCQKDAQLDGEVQAQVQADDLAVATFRDRPATAKASGKVRAHGADIDKLEVSFDLTMTTEAGKEPRVCGSIDGEEICD